MNQKKTFLKVKDFSVSGEIFELVYDEALDMLKTYPQPKNENLPQYYKSEDYISHTDAKRNLFEKVYHIVRRVALKRKLKLINSFSVSEKLLLDVGCGTGDFLKTAKDNGWKIKGVEPNSNARKIANLKNDNNVLDVDAIKQFDDHSFDVITLWHVLEHLPNLNQEIQNLNRLLKPNGRLIIAVPNFNCYDAKYYKQFWAAYDVPRHLWHFSQKAISKLFLKVDLTVEKTLPLKFDAYYVSLLSEQYKSGYKNPLRAFLIGFLSNFKAMRSGEYSSLIYVLKKQ